MPLAQATWAQQMPLRILSVTGQGEVRVPTSRSAITLGVEVTAPTAQAAQQEAAQRSQQVMTLLQNRQVQRLQTTGIQLSPRYRYDEGGQTLEGFTASNTVSFEVLTPQAGALMDAAVQAGATRIDGVQFLAEDTLLKVAEQQALQKATEAAQTQAQAVLDALNLTSQEVIGIQINGASAPPMPGPVPMYKAMTADAMASPTPVAGGDQTVYGSVTLQIRY